MGGIVPKYGLTDKQQALMVFVGTWLAVFSVWAALGFPTDRSALGTLASGLAIGTVFAIKEAFGVAPAVPMKPPPAVG